MAGPVYEAKFVDSHDIMKVFAAEGVDFLLSCDGKVVEFQCTMSSLIDSTFTICCKISFLFFLSPS